MPVPIDIPATVTQYYGVFNLRKLLASVREFIEQEGYDVIEPGYKHKVGGEGTDVEVKMEADRKETHYTKFKIKVELRISDMKDVETTREGEKVKLQHGRIRATVSGGLELDYQKRFEANKFLQGLRDFYHSYILKQQIDEIWWDKVHSSMFNLQRFMRDQLQFEAR